MNDETHIHLRDKPSTCGALNHLEGIAAQGLETAKYQLNRALSFNDMSRVVAYNHEVMVYERMLTAIRKMKEHKCE